MLKVQGGDVGQLEDLLVAQPLLKRAKQRVGNTAMFIDEAVGVREDQALHLVVAGCHRPVGDRPDLLLGHTEVPHGLAVLGEDELAPRRPSSADLA